MTARRVTRSSLRLTRRLLAGAAAVAVLGSLTACAGPTGESIAHERAAEVAEELGDRMTPPVIHSREADWLIAEHVPSMNSDFGEQRVTVEALAWSGSSGDDEGAQIDVRIRVDVESHSATSFGGRSWQAGSATRCYHYDIIGYRFYDNDAMREIDCDDRVAPPLPVPDPLPALPKNADELLTGALADPDVSEQDLRRLFPQDFISIETDHDEGRLIVAIGVPTERECTVAVRAADGTVNLWHGYKRIWLEPGEIGCSTRLVTDPPL